MLRNQTHIAKMILIDVISTCLIAIDTAFTYSRTESKHLSGMSRGTESSKALSNTERSMNSTGRHVPEQDQKCCK
jgi:hypothetical protein